MELIKYNAARRAVVEAKTFDDVKDIINLSEAARAYAKMAGNREMEIDAIEIRVRAERKLGEILGEMKKAGIGLQGNQAKGEAPQRITFKELGITGNASAIPQRLAMLPEPKFESDMTSWRSHALTATRLEIPLQSYRIPSIRGDRQKAAVRLGRKSLDAKDPLDRYRAPDGRRIADWRSGEMKRLRDLAERVVRCVNALEENMPVANADPLATMEMLFRPESLLSLLESIWEIPVDCGDAGLNQKRIDASRVRRTTQCEHCGKDFLRHNPSGKARAGKSNEGRFCSRACSHEAMRSIARKDYGGSTKTEIGTGR